MRTTVDLPDPLLRELRRLAEKRGVSLMAIIREAVVKELQGEFDSSVRIEHPLIRANGRSPYNLTNAEIDILLT